MKTYLSQFANIDGRDVDRYKLHTYIWTAFPGHPQGTTQPFQFRVDEETGTILVRSITPPSWGSIGVKVREEQHPWGLGDIVQVDAHVALVKRNSGKEIRMTRDEEFQRVERKLIEAGLRPVGFGLQEADDADPEPGIHLQSLWVNLAPIRKFNVTPRHVRCMAEVTDVSALHKGLNLGIERRKKVVGFGMVLLRPVDVVL